MLVFLDERYKHARRVDGGASKGGGVFVQTLCDVAKQHLAARGCRVHPLFACADVRCAACDKSARRTAPPAGTITLAVVVSGPGDEHAAEEARSALHRLASEHAGVRLSERLRLVGVGWVNAGCEESLLGEHLVADEDASQRTPTASAGKKRGAL